MALVRRPCGAECETFSFEINGLQLYIKGANVVPLDVLETRVTPAALRQLVLDAKEANMNSMRVWGGGRYFKGAVCMR